MSGIKENSLMPDQRTSRVSASLERDRQLRVVLSPSGDRQLRAGSYLMGERLAWDDSIPMCNLYVPCKSAKAKLV